MARRTDHRSESRYSLRFGTATFLLIAGTLVLVLFVLPQRFVLRPGFRESGMMFPSPSTPFELSPSVPVAARALPERPGPPPEIPPGPAEAFWAEVVPLLERGLFAEALPVFDRYLVDHPDDADVRRERANTLLAAGRLPEAIDELRQLLGLRESFDQRLTLARALRDVGRTDEAAAEYSRLAATRPEDRALELEWAQTYAWAERYAEAAAVLERALARDPTATSLRVELARVYYSIGRLEDARALLASLDANVLAAQGAGTLRDDIVAALYVPPPPPPTPPTLLERALAAREARDLEGARALFEEALRESGSDPEVWQAYADLLEYELGDLEGALAALLEVERLNAPSADLQYRLAQLEIWTGRLDEATLRLQELLRSLEAGAAGSVSRADVHATLGDLSRWEGNRLAAAEQYDLALASDPTNARARTGLAALESEVARALVEIEAPRVAAAAYSIADTDDFVRVDLGAEWVEVDGRWIWGGVAGNRWISGVSLDGSDAQRQGAYVDLEVARWWRLGTWRGALDFGVQRIRSDLEASFGGSLGHRGRNGVASELRYEHGPAYPIAVTLQSLLAQVVQDRFLLTHARPLGELWSVAAAVDGALLRADAASVPPATDTGTGRIQGAVSVGRTVSPIWTVGLTTRSLVFTDAAPVTTVPGGTRRLFWDPRFVVSVGPYAQLTRDLSRYWKITARLGPGVAFIDERGSPGSDLVPHISAETGLLREGPRFSTALDLFYYQGQFDGYRTFGARLTLSGRDFSSLSPGP